MYSFSAEPGSASALNKLFSSCSVKGAISADVILENIQRLAAGYILYRWMLKSEQSFPTAIVYIRRLNVFVNQVTDGEMFK